MTEVANKLQARIDSLRQSAVANFDPVRLRYIASLAEKATAREGAVTALLEEKALHAVEDYLQRYRRASSAAATLLAETGKEFPEAVEHAQELLQNGQFPLLRKLARRLQHESRRANISALVTVLDEQQGQLVDGPDSAPLDDLLRQQEADLVDSMTQQADAKNPSNRKEELRGARRFRNSLVKQNADKVVTQAIQGIPQDCGPLNPQRLATRSLETMRDLSPHYLSRFVSYIDTLFWLENSDKGSGK